MNGNFVFSVSYGDFTVQHGGTDKVIREHFEMFNAKGIKYVFLFPIHSNSNTMNNPPRHVIWGLTVNGTLVDVTSTRGIKKHLDAMCRAGDRCIASFVHHLWRSSLDDLCEIINLLHSRVYIYLHDFFVVCNNGNNVNCFDNAGLYCGFGLINSLCKASCAYHTQANNSRIAFRKFLQNIEYETVFIAPSSSTSKIFLTCYPDLAKEIKVIPHQKIACSVTNSKKYFLGEKIRVGYLGAQNSIKGWPVFKKLILALKGDPRYDFFYLGSGKEKVDGVANTYVSVQSQGKDAMVNALKTNYVDISLLLSNCPETYSYTYFEALAASNFVVTFTNSGNIRDMVESHGNGVVVPDEDSLIDMFYNGKIGDMLYEYRKELSRHGIKLSPSDELINLICGTIDYGSICNYRIDQTLKAKIYLRIRRE